jgi:hypothetical protein
MATYLIIGLIVQLIIVVERAIRFPELWAEGWNHLMFWIGFLATVAINVVVWPFAIVCEIYAVYNNQ